MEESQGLTKASQGVVHTIHICHRLLVELNPRSLSLVAGIMFAVASLVAPQMLPLLLEADKAGKTQG
jgi:hypothetical protein